MKYLILTLVLLTGCASAEQEMAARNKSLKSHGYRFTLGDRVIIKASGKTGVISDLPGFKDRQYGHYSVKYEDKFGKIHEDDCLDSELDYTQEILASQVVENEIDNERYISNLQELGLRHNEKIEDLEELAIRHNKKRLRTTYSRIRKIKMSQKLILMGYKGTSHLDSGYFFAPYFPIGALMTFHERVKQQAYSLWCEDTKHGNQEKHSDHYWHEALLKLVPSVQWAIQEEVPGLVCKPSNYGSYDYEFKYGDVTVAMSKLGTIRNETIYTVFFNLWSNSDSNPRGFDLSSPEEYNTLIAALKREYADRMNYHLSEQRRCDTMLWASLDVDATDNVVMIGNKPWSKVGNS